MKRFGRWLALAAVVLLLGAALCVPGVSRAARLVRVGYTDMIGFVYTDADGRQSGYVYDLMMECAQMTNRDYIFVRVEPEHCYEMLKSGQIDLCVGVPASIEEREYLSFSNEAVITTPLSLVVRPTSPMGYEDYATLDGGTVGVYGANMSMQQLKAMLVVRGATVELDDSYTSRQQLLFALGSGMIDAAVLNSDLGISDLRVVASFSQRNYFCAALKDGDQALLEETDKALRELRLSRPGLTEELYNRYKLVNDNVYPSLTKDELKYISKGREIRVAVSRALMLDNTEPVQTVRLVLEELSKKTGLKFTCLVQASEAEALSTLRAGKADIMLNFDSDYGWAQDQNVGMTSAYLDSTYRMITLPGIETIRSVAAVEDSYIQYRLELNGKQEIRLFADEAACIQAVLDGTVDAALCWTPYAEQALYEMGSQGLVYDDVETMGGPVGIAVSKMASFRLLPILNKAIGCIRPQRFQTIALAPVGELFEAQQKAEARRLTLAFVLTLLVALAALAVFALWVRERLRTASLQVRARNDYLRAMTSQIRRPSQTIQGVVAGGSRINRADTANALASVGAQLSELASEVEVMSQLDDHTFNLTPVPVRPEDVFQRLTGYVRQRAVNRGVQLDIRMPRMECPVVMLDEEAYRRVCLIILENVLRRTENGGRIELSFDLERVREKKNQWILVTSVGDDGAMLSRQFVRRISERTRRDSERVLGLRLMTAKRVVQAMNGEMGVRQRPNAGMRMTVRLPVDQAEPLQMMSLSHGVYGGKGLLAGMNILLAEENPVTSQLLYSLLVNEGAHVDLAENGQQVQQYFLDSPPAFYQAILTDTQLPGDISGAHAAAMIRDLPRRDCSSVFIVGMQAGTQPVAPADAKAMNIILQKPINTATLCRRLHTWLSAG